MHIRLINLLLALVLLVAPVPAFAQAPAEQTELAKNGISIKTEIYSPSKGLVTNISDFIRDKSAAKVLNNLQMIEPGVWTSKGVGWTRQSSGSISSNAAAVESLAFESGDGAFHYFIQCGTSFYEYDVNARTAANITAGMTLSTSAIPSLAPTNSSTFILCNGLNAKPYYWTGATMASPTWSAIIGGTTFTNPQMSATYYGRQVYAGCQISGVYQGYTIVISNQSGWNIFTTTSPPAATDAGNITLPTTECGRITGLYPWRKADGEQVLLIACQHGLFELTGSDATTFAVKLLTKEFGVVNNRTWVRLGNDLYFLANDGIRSLSNSLQGNGLIPSNASYPVQDLINRINQAQLSKIFACHNPTTQEIQFWIPIDSNTVCRNAIVMKYLGNSNDASTITSFDPIFSTKSGTTVNCMSNDNGLILGGGATGIIQQHYLGDVYGGEPMPFDFLSAFVGSNSPSQSASIRKFEILCEGGRQSFTAEAYTLTPLSTQQSSWVLADSRRILMSPGSTTALQTWTTGTTTNYSQTFPFESKGTGRYWMLHFAGNTPVLNGVATQSNANANNVVLPSAAGATNDLVGYYVTILDTGENRTITANTYSGGNVTITLSSPFSSTISTGKTAYVQVNDSIDLVGFQPILNVGGWRQ